MLQSENTTQIQSVDPSQTKKANEVISQHETTGSFASYESEPQQT